MAKYETLVDVFHDAIKTFPDNPLFGTKKNGAWTWTSYLEFGRSVDRVRAGLQALGLKRGDRLALIANNRVEWAVVVYACLGLGVAYVPMYEAQQAKEWEFIVADCEAKAIVVANDAICDKLRPLLGKLDHLKTLVSLDPGTKTGDGVVAYAALEKADKVVPTVKVEPGDTACFVYTSGTTGNPKGVVLSHGNIASNLSAVHQVLPLSPMDRSLSFLPWAHVFGQVVELHTLFSMGASMALCEAIDKILDNLQETNPTLLFSVPRIFNKLYAAVQKQISSKPGVVQSMVKSALATRAKQRAGEEVSLGEGLVLALTDKVVFAKVRARFGGKLRFAFSGGAAISREVAEFIDSLGVTVYEGYGLTETSPILTANYPGHRKIGSVGLPVPGSRVEITEEGEIVAYGPNVMQGYHNRPEENAAVLTPDGGFKTGDMGKLDADGFLTITGRIKEQYKLENGKYVVPTPLEEQIKLSPYVLNVMVYGDNRPHNVALVVADVGSVEAWAKENGVSGSGAALLEDPKVRELFKQQLAEQGAGAKGFEGVKDFALVAEDFTTENGMLTASLKLKRRAVFERYQDVLEALYTGKRKGAAAQVSASA